MGRDAAGCSYGVTTGVAGDAGRWCEVPRAAGRCGEVRGYGTAGGGVVGAWPAAAWSAGWEVRVRVRVGIGRGFGLGLGLGLALEVGIRLGFGLGLGLRLWPLTRSAGSERSVGEAGVPPAWEG